MKYKINQKKIKMHNPEGVECETSFFATRDHSPRWNLNATFVKPGRTRRFAPTTPEYVGFGRGIPPRKPLTKVALMFHLGFQRYIKNAYI